MAMTYLEEYLKEHNCTERDFWVHQEDYDGFCPDDVGLDECPPFVVDCCECWNREINKENHRPILTDAIESLERIYNNCEEIDKHIPLDEQSGYKMFDDYCAVYEVLQNEKKYEWHDLRKNPDDLPQLLHSVLVVIEEDGEYIYEISSKVDSRYMNYFNNGWTCIGNVIAWKYFEEFIDE